MRSSTETNRLQTTINLQRDSIYLHDSIFVRVQADTVFLERWHTRWRDRETVKTDTITQMMTRTETIEKPYVPAFYKVCAAFAILFALYLLVKLVLFLKTRFFN